MVELLHFGFFTFTRPSWHSPWQSACWDQWQFPQTIHHNWRLYWGGTMGTSTVPWGSCDSISWKCALVALDCHRRCHGRRRHCCPAPYHHHHHHHHHHHLWIHPACSFYIPFALNFTKEIQVSSFSGPLYYTVDIPKNYGPPNISYSMDFTPHPQRSPCNECLAHQTTEPDKKEGWSWRPMGCGSTRNQPLLAMATYPCSSALPRQTTQTTFETTAIMLALQSPHDHVALD